VTLPRLREELVISLLRSHQRIKNSGISETAKQRTALFVNDAMNHLRADFHAEQTDYDNTEPIAQDCQRKTRAMTTARLHGAFRNRYDASTLVMKRTNLIGYRCIPAQLR
jgi:hypothetical protein